MKVTKKPTKVKTKKICLDSMAKNIDKHVSSIHFVKKGTSKK